MKVLNEKFERKVLNKVEQKSKVTIVEENCDEKENSE